MKNKKLSICLLAIMLSSIVYAAPQIVDYKGSALGEDIPSWVMNLASGNSNSAELKRALKCSDDTMLFSKAYLCKSESELELTKKLADLEMTEEIKAYLGSYSYERTLTTDHNEYVKLVVKYNELKYNNYEISEIYGKSIKKLGDYWTAVKVLKPGKSIGSTKASDYDISYRYYVVYGMNQKDALKAANDVQKSNPLTNKSYSSKKVHEYVYEHTSSTVKFYEKID